jgi:predicted lipoprotein
MQHARIVHQSIQATKSVHLSSTKLLVSPVWETSAEIAKARSPISRATFSMWSFLLPTSATRAHSFAEATAQERPIPLPAPVTILILPFIRSGMSDSLAEFCRND